MKMHVFIEVMEADLIKKHDNYSISSGKSHFQPLEFSVRC